MEIMQKEKRDYSASPFVFVGTAGYFTEKRNISFKYGTPGHPS
jgi:hypothetical protein